MENISNNPIDNPTPEQTTLGEPIHFPEKPALQEEKTNWNKSLSSLAMYVGVYYFFISKDLVFVGMLVGIIIIHELGHFFAMKLYNYTNLGIYFIPFLGAIATGNKKEITQKQDIIISLAGPLPGILIGTTLMFMYAINNEFLYYKAGQMFVIINVFNLIPVHPFDGGRVLRALFFAKSDLIGIVFLCLSTIVFGYLIYLTHNYYFGIIILFQLMALPALVNNRTIRKNLSKHQIDFEKPYDALTDQEYWLIREEMGQVATVPYGKWIVSNHYQYSVNEEQIKVGVKNILLPKFIKDLRPIGKSLVVFIWILAIAVALFMIFQFPKINYLFQQ